MTSSFNPVDTTQTMSSQSRCDCFACVWSALSPVLSALVLRLVYASRVPAWAGQEDAIKDDIIQETAGRMLERIRKAELGEASPIQCMERMAIVTALNYCRDLRRREWRLIRFGSLDIRLDESDSIDERDLAEIATEHAYQEAIFTLVAGEIARFPAKQRAALLADLANLTVYDHSSTALQSAFLKVGISLQDYRQPSPTTAQARTQQSALLYHAYKRLGRLPAVKQYVKEAAIC